MELVPITSQGITTRPIDDLPEIALEVMEAVAEMYRATGYQPPWVGYLALEDGKCVGTCAFKGALHSDRVEIAYFTFPEHEGRGVATRMASQLMAIAREQKPTVVVTAQTLPQENASTRILEKLGFTLVGETDHVEDGKVWEWRFPS